jgi:hypothetical protein
MRSASLQAWPVQATNDRSPWITVPAFAATALRKVLGSSPYDAKLGVHTWLNGAFWLREDREARKGLRLVVNANDVGKNKVEELRATVEADLVYPLLRGREVGRWVANPSMSIIVPHSKDRPSVGIPETTMRKSFPKAYDYFNKLRRALEERSGFTKYVAPSGGPFFAVYNIGT